VYKPEKWLFVGAIVEPEKFMKIYAVIIDKM
jgi:hypothetical protein